VAAVRGALRALRAGRAVAALALAALSAAALAQTARPGRVVVVAALADALAPQTLDAFSAETGLRLVLDAFPTPEAVETAVSRGGYDVAMLSAPALARAQEAGRLAPLDPAAIPALARLDPALARLAPGGALLGYSAFGLAYDARRARERLGEKLGERTLDGWETALRPETLKAFSDCGFALPDDPPAMLAAIALALKIDPASRRPADLRRVFDRLAQARVLAKGVAAPAALVADLAAGELCLAPVTAADAALAAARAGAAGEGAEIVFMAPREGAPVALDALAILRDAAHPAEAAAFVDFALRPEQLARALARTRYAPAIPVVRALVDPALAQDAALFPDAATAARLFAPAPMDAGGAAQTARDWARIKGGK
jgi:putrescine transport system substrate-binding protein